MADTQNPTRPTRRDAIAVATASRDEGMAAAEHAADPRRILAVDAEIEKAIASGRRFSANTIRDRLPVTSSGLVGARVKSYSMRREDGHPLMVCVGRELSTLPSTHAAEIKVWLGWDAHQAITRAAAPAAAS